MNKYLVYGGLLVAIVIAILNFLAFVSLAHRLGSPTFGSVSTNCQSYTTCVSDLYSTTQFGGTGSIQADGTLTVTGASTLGGAVTTDAGLTQSYTNATTTTLATETLVVGDIAGYNTVLVGTVNVSGTTFTFPATSTVTTFIPAAGDMARQCWYNATSTSGAFIKFTAGAGWDFEVASTTLGAAASIANSPILPTDSGCFTYIRKTNTDIVAQFVPFVDGD